MRLYHYTSTWHLPRNLAAKMLTVAESNFSSPLPGMPPPGEHVGPDVVWLMKAQNRRTGLGLGGSSVDKTAVRITVEVPDHEVHHWPEWANYRGINKQWQRRLEKDMYPFLWYVVERPVQKSEGVEVAALSGASGGMSLRTHSPYRNLAPGTIVAVTLTATNRLDLHYYDVPAVASIFGVSQRSVWRWIANGLISYSRIGPKLVRFTADDIERFVQESSVTS